MVYYYGSFIACVILVINMVSILKKVKNEQETAGSTFLICI